jgi:hypothetical protein
MRINIKLVLIIFLVLISGCKNTQSAGHGHHNHPLHPNGQPKRNEINQHLHLHVQQHYVQSADNSADLNVDADIEVPTIPAPVSTSGTVQKVVTPTIKNRPMKRTK